MLTIGANHRTATASRLGELTLAAEAFRRSVRDGVFAGGAFPADELAVLTTCNRVEIYAAADTEAVEEAVRVVDREVFGPAGGKRVEPYRLDGPEAVRHLCRVAAGLDSMVIGEHEIAGQVSRAFKEVVTVGRPAGVLGKAAEVARRASRRVRSETGIGRYPASVSSVSVDLARERLGDLSSVRAIVVGAGKAGLLVCRALGSAGVASLTVVNRSGAGALEVASQVGGEAAELGELEGLLERADLVISATGADGLVIETEAVRRAVARRAGRRSLLVLDLAMPGDVHPEVGAVPGVDLLTLEDVKDRVHRHLSLRRDELGAAERVVEEVVDDFVRSQEAPEVDEMIRDLRRAVEDVRAAEVDRWLESRESEGSARDELDRLTRSLVNKLLHDTMVTLRSEPFRTAEGRMVLRRARELFGMRVRGPDGGSGRP